MVVGESPYQVGWGGTPVPVVADEGFGPLDAPVRRVAGECVPLRSPTPPQERVISGVGRVMRTVRDRIAY